METNDYPIRKTQDKYGLKRVTSPTMLYVISAVIQEGSMTDWPRAFSGGVLGKLLTYGTYGENQPPSLTLPYLALPSPERSPHWLRSSQPVAVAVAITSSPLLGWLVGWLVAG
jgi:hypothetical protein